MAQTMTATCELLYSGADWTFEAIDRVYAAIDEIAKTELKLDLYPTQIEVITSEQMLDAYASIGMPLMYRHWSFGKRLLQDEPCIAAGARGLAYEIVINSNPCICYIMEENTMTMQTLVIAHAAFGHNHFFKNNHLFQQWTDASGIIDYLAFARRFISDCEVQHGSVAVERVLDAAHSLMVRACIVIRKRGRSI
jgi:spore cortex formation protein SpoVR/YcgB (stage V sporulation)